MATSRTSLATKTGLIERPNFLGNSGKSMKETRFSPLFLGIAIGVIMGMIPFHIPGVPYPVRLGFAGGPLIAAIVFSLVGSVGKVVWYIPYSANLALRELGIILFLASAGLGAGRSFFEAAFSLEGAKWMTAGIAVTMIPLLTTGIVARVVLAPKLPDHLRSHRGQHDRPTSARVCQFTIRLRSQFNRLRGRLSTDDDPENHRRPSDRHAVCLIAATTQVRSSGNVPVLWLNRSIGTPACCRSVSQ